MTRTTDGFLISEEDLKARGPGDFFGKRQHGLPQLKVADFASDVALLQEAKQAAEELEVSDPELSRPEHAPLRRRVEEMFREESFNWPGGAAPGPMSFRLMETYFSRFRPGGDLLSACAESRQRHP